MKLLGARQLSVLLVGTLLLCHGAFGALHLVCIPPVCAADAEHSEEHHAAAGGVGDSHEHPAEHGASTGYFAVLAVGLLGLLLELVRNRALLRIRLDARRPAVLHLVLAVFHPPPTLTPSTLQVFRL